MPYSETLEYIYSRLPMFSRVGSNAIKKGFSNILALCNILGNPQQKTKFIHVAGTNGKGSVSHMLASVLQTAGYKTGLYTSPHLKDFRERIKINGQMISQDEVVSFIENLKPGIEKINPSFFEITVAMAFDHFARHRTDIAVIETGLGGRLDSTNIIQPELSVITNIGYDHMNILGETLKEIATEKAGIIKTGIPVIIGESQAETDLIFKNTADKLNASISFADKQLQVTEWNYKNEELVVEIAGQNKIDHKKYHLDLTGSYQIKNILPVIVACQQLKNMGWKIEEQHVKEGLKHTKKTTGLHGRWEIIHRKPSVALDVAHNEDGIRQLLYQLEISSYHKLHIVLGMVKDKDVNKVLSMLPKNASYYFSSANMPRAMPANDIKEKATMHKLNGRAYPNVNEAIAAAIAASHKDDLILVCGSVFLIGEVKIQL